MKRILFFVSALLLLAGVAQAQNDTTAVPIAKPRKEKIPLSERLRDKIVLGGSLGASFGNPTSVNISPIIGYKVTEDLVLGAGPSYMYYGWKIAGRKYSYSAYGGRLYGRQRVFQNLYAQAEFEALNVNSQLAADPNRRTWIYAPLVGGAYVQPLGERSSVSISVLYNLNYSDLFPYSNPIIRLGFNL